MLSGKGIKQDDTQAMKFFGKACEGGHYASCYHQGALMYLEDVAKSDKTTPSSPTTSANLTNSSSNSTNNTTNSVSDNTKLEVPKKQLGPITTKQLNAIKILEANCINGESDSCYFVGSHYLRKGYYYYIYCIFF